MMTRRMKTLLTMILCMAMNSCPSYGFVAHRTSRKPAFTSSLTQGQQGNMPRVILQSSSDLSTTSSTSSSSSFAISDLLSLVASSTTSSSTSLFDASLGAQLCSGLAHITLDFFGMWTASRFLLRLSAVIGRIFVISADYLPDSHIHTEELIIQSFLMMVALKQLFWETTTNTNTNESSLQQPKPQGQPQKQQES